MGSVYSKNTVNDVVNLLTNVVIDATQGCQSSISQDQVINISGNNNVKINLGKIDWSQVVNYNTTCSSMVSTQNTIDDNLKQEVKEITKALNQNLNLNPGSTEAENVANLVTTLSVQIKESFNQTCQNVISQDQVINISGNRNSQITASLDWNQTTDGVFKCIQEDSAVNNIKEQLEQQIRQKADVEVANALGPIIIVILIVTIIIAYFIFKGYTDTLKSQGLLIGIAVIIVIVIVVIIIYLVLARWQKWWPFRKQTT